MLGERFNNYLSTELGSDMISIPTCIYIGVNTTPVIQSIFSKSSSMSSLGYFRINASISSYEIISGDLVANSLNSTYIKSTVSGNTITTTAMSSNTYTFTNVPYIQTIEYKMIP